VVDDVSIDSETLLVTDFINLKIKPTKSFEYAHRGRLCMRIHRESTYMCMSICIYTIFLKKTKSLIYDISFNNLRLEEGSIN
jgi:hypothetical protein